MYVDRILNDFSDDRHDLAKMWYSRARFEAWSKRYNENEAENSKSGGRPGWSDDVESLYDP